VVEVVKHFAEGMDGDQKSDVTFNSEILAENIILDQIIFKTCAREVLKKKKRGFYLLEDKQVELLIEIACNQGEGAFVKEDLNKLLLNIGYLDRTEEIIQTHLDHPFFKSHDANQDAHKIRFDFLVPYFKMLRTLNILQRPNDAFITDEQIRFIAHELKGNSQVSKTLLERIEKNKLGVENNIVNILRYLSKEFDSISGRISKEILQSSISNLFQLLINVSNLSPRDLLIDSFGSKLRDDSYAINHFYLFSVQDSSGLLMDLSGLYFSFTKIDGYSNLLLCKFDSETYFDESCVITNSGPRDKEFTAKESTALPLHFDSKIGGDNMLHQFFNGDKGVTGQMNILYALESFKSYFRCFYEGSILVQSKSRKEVETNYKYSRSKRMFQEIHDSLLESDIVAQEGLVLRINKKFRTKVDTFLHQSLNFSELNGCVDKLVKKDG
jgi:hypothetical protein